MKIEKITVFRKDLIPNTGPEDYIYTESKFDPETGLVLDETRYTPDGQVEEIARREYDKDGFLTMMEILDAVGSILEKRTFEIDEKGRNAREFVHYSDDSADRIENTFDEKDRIVKRVLFDDDNELETAEVFEYQGDHLIREAELDAKEYVLKEKLFAYSQKGLLEEEIVIDNEEDLYLKKEIQYNSEDKVEEITTYNKTGEALERLSYFYNEQSKPITIIEENRLQRNTTSLSYDQNSEVVLEEEKDHNGQLIRKVERSFNEKGLVEEIKVLTRNLTYGITRSYVLTSKYLFK